MHEVKVKDKFKARYSELTDWEPFIDISLQWLRRSIRVNTLKTTVSSVQKRLSGWKLEQVPWCREGFFISHPARKDVGNLVEHFLGYVYVQEAASMIPGLVLNPKPGELVLDMAAAPGSKTTHMAALMKNKGLLIANDVKGSRLKSLGMNVQRCGITNVLLTLMNGQRFSNYSFDKILLDAPCSGTGTIRKSLKTLQIWNPNMVRRLAGQQRQLIKTAFENLKDGGEMVYSTCSLEPEEDEGIISYLLENYENAQMQDIKLKITRGKPITEFNGKEYHQDVKKCLRIWPQDNDTEGFFVAKIKKI